MAVDVLSGLDLAVPYLMRHLHIRCLRDAVAWLQGVAVIRGDTADECVGVDFGEQEYLTVLEFLQCMSNIVINDGGTGLFAKLQVGTLLHGDKYVFVTEASQLGFWSIGQVFSRYRNYEGEKDRLLTEQERAHLTGLMDEATVVVDKFADRDPEQAKWYAHICERFHGTQVSVVATPWDQALANRVPLDLGAVAAATLDAKLAMAEVVLRGADRANRRRQGLPEEEEGTNGNGQRGQVGPPRRPPEFLPPAPAPDARILSPQPGPDTKEPEPGFPAPAVSPDTWPDDSEVRVIPAQSAAPGPAADLDIPDLVPDSPDPWPDESEVRIIPTRPKSDTTGPEPGTP